MAEVVAGVVWSVVELWDSLFTYYKIGSRENGLDSQRPSSSDLPSPAMLLSQRLYGLSPNSVTTWTPSAQAYEPWEDISDVKA